MACGLCRRDNFCSRGLSQRETLGRDSRACDCQRAPRLVGLGNTQLESLELSFADAPGSFLLPRHRRGRRT